MRRLLAAAVLAAFATTQMGCYTTRVTSGIQPGSNQTYEQRQWFAILGLIPLSGPAGNECRNGLATAESQYNVVDALLVFGLTVAGGIAGGVACNNTDPVTQASCISGAAGVVPLLIQPRTVRYTCIGGGAASVAPPAMTPVPSPATAVSQQ
jgi:hypothetical protein